MLVTIGIVTNKSSNKWNKYELKVYSWDIECDEDSNEKVQVSKLIVKINGLLSSNYVSTKK